MNQKNDMFKNKGFYISLLTGAICLVAVVAVCLNVFSDKSSENLPNLNEPSDIVDQQEDDIELTEDEVENSDELVDEDTDVADAGDLLENDITEPEDTDVVDAATDEEMDMLEKEFDEEENADESLEGEVAEEEVEQTVETMGTDNAIKNLHFDENEQLLWPVAGNVIMKYSMNNTIYHQTLGQYRCNPGVVIEGKVGTEVLSAYDCIVTDISKNEEIGTIVKTSIGDDYTLLYGQLENLEVSVGDSLKEGDVIGTIASPTKYYVEEGSNLFFQVLSGDETVDPMILLR